MHKQAAFPRTSLRTGVEARMAKTSTRTTKYQTPLRQAQRDLIRQRIKDAAKDLFYRRHYDSTTMDEIAAAAGVGRSTIYLHYKDRDEILADVIADYVPKAKKQLSTLPGPHPTVEQIDRWIRKVAKFVEQERAPLSIILELRRDRNYLQTLEELTSELMAGLGRNNPRFAEASRMDAEPALRARGLLLFRQLTYSCELYLSDPADARNKALLSVTAEDLQAFLGEQ